MTNNNKNMNSQFNRMKQLMNYGLNESKKQSYSNVEYSKVAADGKTYGIVREGTKYYIKVSNKKNDVLAENFDYIGGFRNRKDNEYTSFANAQKQFDLKMMSINEANKEHIVIESWNPDKKENLTVEATDKMRKEISRERQIMRNVMMINEQKPQSLNPITESEVKKTEDMDTLGETEKNNIKKEEPKTGKPVGTNGDPFDEKASIKNTDINESSSEVLGWNRDSEEYMDKSHGTEVGDSAPFDDATAKNIDDNKGAVTSTGEAKHGVVECNAMHDSQNQNCPKPGVGEIGDDAPFDDEKGKQIDEAIDDIEGGDDVDAAEPVEDVDVEEPVEDVDVDVDVEEPVDDEVGDETFDDEEGFDDEGIDEEEYEDDFAARLSALEDKIDMIADAVGADVDETDFDAYTDDDLYDDEETESEESFDDNGEEGFEDNEEEVFESRAYRKMRIAESKKNKVNEGGMKPFKDAGRVPSGNMNKLDDFGKHPAYQKKVMSLPPKDMEEFPGYYDMNDDSVKNDIPYGKNIGDGAPFEIEPQEIENAIVESLMKYLKKK